MKFNSFMAFLLFFVVFFRLSLFFPNLYLGFIPAVFGLIYFFRRLVTCLYNGELVMRRREAFLFSIFTIIFVYCVVFDLFQTNKSFQALFTVRMIMLFVLSYIPAYYLVNKYLSRNEQLLEKIIVASLIIQIIIFFVMFFSPEIKTTLYTLFGMADSVNLWEQNAAVRGFGLSGEINFMTPFLMVYMAFFLIKRRYFLIAAICLTQIVNSNMAVLAAVIGVCCARFNISIKVATALIIFILVYSLGTVFFPRFYDEFVSGDGTRTLDILWEKHVFTVGAIDWFSTIFGFQQNISSSIPDLSVSSDMGWVILFNYGGLLFIVLYLLLISSLSIAAFGVTYVAAIWLMVGIIFNTKGLVLGSNGYFFISFIYILLNRRRISTAKISHD